MIEFKTGDIVELMEDDHPFLAGQILKITGTIYDDMPSMAAYDPASQTTTSGPSWTNLDCVRHCNPPVTCVRPTDAIDMVVASADRIFPRRSYDTILKSLMEEMGELSTEIAIVQGTKKRAASPDGVKGEAIDVFVVAVDMLRAAWGNEINTPTFKAAVQRKLNKWEGK